MARDKVNALSVIGFDADSAEEMGDKLQAHIDRFQDTHHVNIAERLFNPPMFEGGKYHVVMFYQIVEIAEQAAATDADEVPRATNNDVPPADDGGDGQAAPTDNGGPVDTGADTTSADGPDKEQ